MSGKATVATSIAAVIATTRSSVAPMRASSSPKAWVQVRADDVVSGSPVTWSIGPTA